MKNKNSIFLYINLFFILAIIGFYLFLDKSVAVWMHCYILNSKLYIISSYISQIFSTGNVFIVAVLIAITACVLKVLNRKNSTKSYTFVAISFFVTLCAAFVLKFTLARYRPELFFSEHLFGFSFFSLKDSCNSFPSGHTIASFSIVISLFYVLKKKWICWILLMVSILIGCSRIILTAHYCSDVLASIYLAILVTWFVNKIFIRIKYIY
jgi:membrane-associated phospholipid phosphatase